MGDFIVRADKNIFQHVKKSLDLRYKAVLSHGNMQLAIGSRKINHYKIPQLNHSSLLAIKLKEITLRALDTQYSHTHTYTDIHTKPYTITIISCIN